MLVDEMPTTFARLADIYRLEGRFDEAIEICSRGLEQFPDNGSGHMVLAFVYSDRGEHEKALIEYHSALKCDPENLLALKRMADIHWETEAYSLARSYYRQLLQRDRFCEEARERARKNPKRPVESTDDSDEVSAAVPSEPMTESERNSFETVTLAKLYISQGHVALAREVCKGIIENDPANRQAVELLEELEKNPRN